MGVVSVVVFVAFIIDLVIGDPEGFLTRLYIWAD